MTGINFNGLSKLPPQFAAKRQIVGLPSPSVITAPMKDHVTFGMDREQRISGADDPVTQTIKLAATEKPHPSFTQETVEALRAALESGATFPIEDPFIPVLLRRAVNAIHSMRNATAQVDPMDPTGIFTLHALSNNSIYGEDIDRFYRKVCKEDAVLAVVLLRACQYNIISPETLETVIAKGSLRGLDVQKVREEVQNVHLRRDSDSPLENLQEPEEVLLNLSPLDKLRDRLP